MTTKTQDSSINVERDSDSSMITVRHFTGALMLTHFEANHLRTLLAEQLDDTPPMSSTHAHRLIEEREALVRSAIQGD